jgi:hypothetical protein
MTKATFRVIAPSAGTGTMANASTSPRPKRTQAFPCATMSPSATTSRPTARWNASATSQTRPASMARAPSAYVAAPPVRFPTPTRPRGKRVGRTETRLCSGATRPRRKEEATMIAARTIRRKAEGTLFYPNGSLR